MTEREQAQKGKIMKKKALATDINVGNKAAGHGSNVPMQPNI